MSSQMDALQSFNYLVENIPHWLRRLDELRAKCDIQYERFTRITQHGEVKLTRKKKQASTESLRPAKDHESHPPQQSYTACGARMSDSLVPQLPTMDSTAPNASIPQGIPRKRPAGSELSDAPSNQCRYRSKNMVVVYYDSEIQEYFEGLVKSIAAARNNLRKGKNTTTFKMRMSSMGLGTLGLDHTNEKKDSLAVDSKLMMTPALARARLSRQSPGNELKCFEDADRHLEEAQSFCERGAHQFLRDGDCHSEIDRTKKRFASCEGIAQREIARLQRDLPSASEEDAEQEEAAEERTLVGDSTPPSDQNDGKALDVSPITKINPPPLKDVKFAGTGAIEIDDDSDSESMEIDMSAIRRTVRSTRV